MAKTTYLDIPAGFDLSYSKTLNSSQRFTFPAVRVPALFSRRRRLKGVTQKSLLPECSLNWNAFNADQKSAWNSAGSVMGQTGFRLYVQDKVLRIQNGLTGDSIPNNLQQTYCGRLTMQSPATNMLLTQVHPQQYWVSSPVHGKKGQREPVLVYENFALPLKIQIAQKSNLTPSGGTPRARYFAIVYSLYQGRTIENICEINLDLTTDWKVLTQTISKVVGAPKSYALFLELNDVHGDLFIDNVVAEHSGLNWCRDSICRDIDQNFTKAFYQVPKNWVAVYISDGCYFGSEYDNNN